MSITIVPPTGLVGGQSFTIKGGLSGYISAPTLYYADDYAIPQATTVKATALGPNNIQLNWTAVAPPNLIAIPSANITPTGFSISHPGMVAGAHHVMVTDGVNSTTTSFAVSAPSIKSIKFGALPTTILVGQSFTLTGVLAGYTAVPSINYSLDSGTQVVLPARYVTAKSFVFTVPPLTLGRHTLTATDGTVSTTIILMVVNAVAQSPSGTLITSYTNSPIVNSVGESWALTQNKQITVNTRVVPLSANVAALCYVNGLVYQKITDGRCWSKVKSADTWVIATWPLK